MQCNTSTVLYLCQGQSFRLYAERSAVATSVKY